MLPNVLVAVAYFYFHFCYFVLVGATLKRSRMQKSFVVISFFINFILFYICSVLELSLVVNWAFFFLFLLAETMVYTHASWRASLFFALNCILWGLGINIFCRCIVSILIDQPLSAFDNHVSQVGNLKSIPIFLGFLLGGIALHLMAHRKIVPKLQMLVTHPQHLAFQLDLMCILYLYLCLNLLLYQSHVESVLLKLWGIKSCIFSLAGNYLGMRYSLQMCRHSDFVEQNRGIQRMLAQNEEKEAWLRSIAYRDALTGAYNRSYALESLETHLQEGVSFSLAFLDLDDLKGVNDSFGHTAGDRYLTLVTQQLREACRENRDILARYGGDEFFLLLPEVSPLVVEQRLAQVNKRLHTLTASNQIPFSMSISYGVVESKGGEQAADLLHAVDAVMYQHKQAHRGRRR